MKKSQQTQSKGLTLAIHQKKIVYAPHFLPEYDYFILSGGFGCGKSFSIVMCILDIVKTYNGYDISVGIGSTTITFAQKTILQDLFALLKKSGSEYSYNSKDSILKIGTITFFMIATENPANVYGYNLSIFLVDEIDELPQIKVIELNKAVRERTRVTLPDGRKPYIMYFSTAHGYRGLYHVVKKLRDTKQKYYLCYGNTKDNPFIAKSQVESLYALYDEMERMAYLEGKFVNLHSGRVYTDYDDDKCRVEPFEITNNMTIYVGQDLNSGFSKATAIVKKDGVLYIVHGWSFKEVGGAPVIMRNTFPNNEILWFPDCSGKEILKGYKQEIIDNGIQCRLGTSNPRILDTVFYVNKLFKLGKLKVFDCKDTDEVSEALKVQAYNDMGQPEKGKGETDPDHFTDSVRYVIYRIVRSDPDFMDLKELSRENVKENGYLNIAGANV